ncbi:hypothetical protein E9531_07915 [Lampropedia puyangensis]|uniref:Lipoprotein n=1 Tax=Lampropedia puyangensis TaxID=1330072 RepID=A0A4S8F5A1_9BURK|nr:Sbal_3080 family lipoprotein [Lampropedia puyangensis]THU02590.1 hypothetical protein E9531_07915 [Lampropedia puyangensis]
MHCTRFTLAIFPISFLLFGCTSLSVTPVSASDVANLKHICIKNNPLVKVTDFVQVLEHGLSRHGITSEVYQGMVPQHCEYTLSYTALRSWDITPYLSEAELTLQHGSRQIAKANYHLKGKGGLSLTKWNSTKSKIDPVIDQLLAHKS